MTNKNRNRNVYMFTHLVSSLKSANLDTTLLSDADGIKYSISEAIHNKPTKIHGRND